jgi:hypothetical protein
VIIKDSCASEGVADGRNGFLIEENAESMAAKLRELIAEPEAMQRGGKGAGEELYISWDDAVANAFNRYEVVIDNYKSGVYGRRDPLKGSWMQSQGELMQILGDIDTARKDLIKNGEELAGEIDMSLRSIRNKALTDAITTGYEMGQNFKRIKREAMEDLESLVDEVIQNFWDKRPK